MHRHLRIKVAIDEMMIFLAMKAFLTCLWRLTRRQSTSPRSPSYPLILSCAFNLFMEETRRLKKTLRRRVHYYDFAVSGKVGIP